MKPTYSAKPAPATRSPADSVTPARADAFMLPARRLRQLTQAQTAAMESVRTAGAPGPVSAALNTTTGIQG